jgi:RNA polymerase sigma-70 factor, ECF subfamily
VEQGRVKEEAASRDAVWPSYDDERSLVRGLRAGCEEAYAELVRRYGERLYEVARRVVGDEEDARDAVQETFLAAYRAIDRFAGTAALATWLHRVAVNAALMILRRRRSRPELRVAGGELGAMVDARQLRTPAAWSGRADVDAERRELAALVRACIAELPPSHQAILLLREIGGLDTVETAGRLGLSANAVKLRAYRARLALRNLIAAHAPEMVPNPGNNRAATV